MNKINLKETFYILYKSLKLLGKYKKIYLIGLLMSSAKYAIKFITPVAYKFITNIVLGQIGLNDYVKFLGVISLFVILVPIFCYGHYLRSTSCVKAQIDNQKTIFSHLVKLPLPDVQNHSSGLYLTQIVDDTLFIDRIFKKYAFTALGKFIIFTSISAVLLSKVSIKVFLISFGVGFIFLAASLFTIPKIKQMELKNKNLSTKLHSDIIDFFNNIVMIRIFNIENPLLNKFSCKVNNIAKNKIISKSIIGISDRLIDLIKIIVQPISIILMVISMIDNLNISDIIFISGIISIYVEGLCNFISFFQNIQNDLICANRVLTILDCKEESYCALSYETSNDPEYIIELKNVDFSYNNEKKVLSNFNLKIKKNQFIVIVGESGCGKSTILKLLQGLYADYDGQILLNGVRINSYGLSALRNKFSYVSQENLLFNKSIESNIKLVKDNINTEEYISAINNAKLYGLIHNIKSKSIGKNGCMLSGGEKQRISIARAFLKNSDIFLLDEFTSSLDKYTEKEILNYIQTLKGKKTIIMVTHRLNYIEDADCIIFIKGGKIVEQGTHQELLNSSVHYKALYKYK